MPFVLDLKFDNYDICSKMMRSMCEKLSIRIIEEIYMFVGKNDARSAPFIFNHLDLGSMTL